MPTTPNSFSPQGQRFGLCLFALLMTVTVFATGCSTTPAVKPTASVMVGAHQSL